jgi:hypothetical protein
VIPAVQHLNTRTTQPTPDTTQEPAVPTLFDIETITRRTHRVRLPVGPEGVTLGVLQDAIGHAATAARQAWNLTDEQLPGDALLFTIEGAVIVVSFVTE